MAVQVGIVGLPNAGSTTLFRALTRAEASASGKEHVGMAAIADDRVQQLAKVVQAKKVTPAAVRVVDVPGTGAALLGNLRQVDALLAVLDGWSGTRDPGADLETLKLELLVADRDLVERRLERIAKQAKSGDATLKAEAAELERILAHLDASGTLAEWAGELPPELETLTTKPLLAIENGPGGVDAKLEAALRGARPRHVLHRRREGEPRVDPSARGVSARGCGDDPHRHRARLHPLRGDPLGRPRGGRLAHRGGAAGQAAARGEDLRRPGRRRPERPLQHLTLARPPSRRYHQIDGCRCEADRLLRPALCSRSLGGRGRGDSASVQGSRRPGTGANRQSPRRLGHRGLRLRADRATGARSSDGVSPPQEAHRCRAARARGARQVGVFLDQRGGDGARGDARRPDPRRLLLMSTTTANELREEVRRRYAESALPVTQETTGCCDSSCCQDEPDARFGETLYDLEQRRRVRQLAALL